MSIKERLGPIIKGVAGAVGGAVAGNTGMIVMTAEQAASLPWYAILISNVVYMGIGFATVYFAPANKDNRPA